jgi:hypothetical protein
MFLIIPTFYFSLKTCLNMTFILLETLMVVVLQCLIRSTCNPVCPSTVMLRGLTGSGAVTNIR